MKSAKYLLQLQKQKQLNDSELARLLKITQPAISQYKAGKRVMDDETCLAIAIELDIDPLQIVGAACIDRAEKSGQKSLWEVFMMRTQTAKTAGVTAALGLALVTNLLTATPAKAAPVLNVADKGLYIMSN